MSYSNTNFPMPIVIDRLPVAGNLSVFDQNFNAVSSHLSNVANLTSSSSAYAQANAAYAQANAAYAQANLSVIPYQLTNGANHVTLTTDGTLQLPAHGNISSQSITIQPIISSSPWVATFGDLAGSNNNYGASVVIDSNNNSYMFCADDSSANTNYIVKFDSSGTEIWQKQIGDANTHYKYSDALHIDASDNIYLSLNDKDGPQNNSYIVKMDTNAGIIWQTNLTGLYRNSEYGIATDSMSNVITVGQTDDGSGNVRILLCKFDSSGVLLQHNFLFNTNSEGGYNLSIDSADNILVVGSIYDNTFGNRMYVGKYANADLSRIWEKTVSGQYIDQSQSYGHNITTDESNNVYVFGNANLNSQGSPAILIKFGSDGSVNWTNRFGDFGCKYQASGFGIAYDSGSVYVSGGVYSNDYGYYILVGKINALTGGLTWLNEFRDPTGVNYVYQSYNTPDKPIAVRNNYISISSYNSSMEGSNNYRATLLRVPTDGTGIGTAGPFVYGKARIPYISATLTIHSITLSSTPGTLTQQPGDLSVSILDGSYSVNFYSMKTEWKFNNTSGLVFPDSTVQYSAAPVFDQPLNTQSSPEFAALTISEVISFSGNSLGFISAQGSDLTANSLELGSLFGNVAITANAINNTKNWIFGTDGTLTMPPGNETTSGWIRWNHARNDFNNYAGAGYVDNYNIYTGMGLFSPNNSIVMGTPADQYSPFIPETTLVFKNDSLYLPANGYIKSHTADYSGYPTLSHYNANVNIQTGSKVVGHFVGGSIDFSGTNNQFISLPYTSDLSGWTTQDFTVEWWQYSTSHTNPYQRPFQIGTYSSGNGFGIGYEDFQFVLRWSGAYLPFGAPNSAIPLNTWQHVAIVRYNNVVTVYADGVAVGSINVSNLAYASSLPFNIGGSSVDGLHDYESGNGLFTGKLYDFRFVIGNALYTNNFTPPSMELDLVANTQLLFLAQTAPSVLTYYSYPNVAHTDANNNNGVSWSSSTPPSSVVTTDYTWTFDTNGTLTSPGDLLPSSNNTGNIGTPDLQWKSLYVSNGSVYIDGVRLSSNSGSLVVGGNITLSNNSSLNDSLGRPIISAASGNIIDGNLVGGGAAEIFTSQDLSFDGGSIESYYDVYAPEIDGGVSSTPQTILNVDGSSSIVQVKRNSSNNWIQTNPILSQGEIGFETDTAKIKIGTGLDTWSSLSYITTDRLSNISGNTSRGITLTTDRGTVLFGNHPEMFPTLTSHFHIMKDDAANVDLFFGDDYNYVKLPKSPDYGVEIGTGGNTWTFGANGTLTLPTNNTITGDLIPSSNNTGNVGTPDLQWKSLYVSNGSIYVDGVRISSNSGSLVVGGSITLSNNSSVNDSLGRPIVSATSGNIIGGNLVGGGASEVFGPEDLSFDGGNIETYHSAYDAAVDGGVSSTPQTILNVDGTGTTIQVKRNSSNNWTQTNPILSQGEIGFETDTAKIKIGTGLDTWSMLSYSGGSGIVDVDGIVTFPGNFLIGTLHPDGEDKESVVWAKDDTEYLGLWWGGDQIYPTSSYGPVAGIQIGTGDIDDFTSNASPVGTHIAIAVNDSNGDTNTWVFDRYGKFIYPDGSLTSGNTVIANGTYDIQSLSNTLIQTSASQGVQTWNFDTTGNLTLPNGSTINDNTNGLLAGSKAVEIKPGGGDNANQLLKIYPTVVSDGNHIHLTSGDLSVTDLFLGDDHQFVRIGTDGNVCIGTDSASNIWQFDTKGNLTLPANTKLNSGGIGNTNSAEFGTAVSSNGIAITSSQIYMGAGTAETRVIVDQNGASLIYSGVEHSDPGAFAGSVSVDPNVTSDYAIAIGPNNSILLGAAQGGITTTEYTTGVGVFNSDNNITGLLSNGNNVIIAAGSLGWSFDRDGNVTFPSGNKFAVVNVPTSSIGQTGDIAGMTAANTTHFFNCVGNYVGVTPPNTALPIIANTVLLMSEIDSANLLTDSTSTYTMTNNTAVTWAANSPFTDGSGSAYFDGSNYLQLQQQIVLSGDFTIEAFVYRTVANNNADGIFSIQGSAGDWDAGGGGFTINGGRIDTYSTSATYYSTPIQTNVWTHIAVSRKGSTIFVYLNGNLVATANEPATLGNGGGYPLIGAFDFYNGTGNPPRTPWNGYITNLRIENGDAIYYQNDIWKRVAWSADTW